MTRKKIGTLFIGLLAGIGLLAQQVDSNFHLYLLIGQSNMAGRGMPDAESKELNSNILMLDSLNHWVPATDPVHYDKPKAAGVGPAIAFAKAMLQENPHIKIGLIPCAWGGSPIKAWTPGATYFAAHPYDDAIQRTIIAQQKGVLKAVLWHQGESDNDSSHASRYMGKLSSLVQQLRKDLAQPQLPFIAGEIGHFNNVDFINPVIRQLPQIVRFTAVVSSKDLTHKGDNLHFDAASARELGRRYAAALQTITAGESKNPKPPIMGWSSWNHFRIHINEAMIREQADAMIASGLYEAGYRYINIDDGYFGGRDRLGNLFANAKFPSGMKALADYIHGKGLKAGIYSDAGKNTCGSIYDKDSLGIGVGMYDHIVQDCHSFFTDWGYDFLKVDWCGGQKQKLDEQTEYTKIINAVKAINKDIVFNVCRWQFPGEWAIKQADSWRISGDIRDNFSSILKIIDLNADLYQYASPGHYNDMDMLQVGRGMSYEEDKTHFSMWCMFNSPLLAGNDLRSMSKQTLEILSNKELIAINQDIAFVQAQRVFKENEVEVWVKRLGNGNQKAIAIMNRSGKDQTISFSAEKLGIDPQSTLRDLWLHKNIGKIGAAQTFMIPRHGIVVLNAN